MNLPPLLPIGFSAILYLILIYILGMGLWQFIAPRIGREVRARSLVPLGAAAVVFGVIALIQHYRMAFGAIEEAGDISPSIVAGAFKDAYSNLTLGLLCLAIAFVFRFVNDKRN